MDDPWGTDQPAAIEGEPPPLPSRLARLAQVERKGRSLDVDPYGFEWPWAGELPEVRALMDQGWAVLGGAPLYSLLPAAWPAEHRTWVPDRLPKIAMRGATSDDPRAQVVPASDDWSEHDEVAREAASAGLPAPPPDRIWLLRSPWPRIPLAAVYLLLDPGYEDPRSNPVTGAYRRATEVLTWDEDRAWAALPDDVRDLLTLWEAHGRTGEAASSVLEPRLTPQFLASAAAAGIDEPSVIAWLRSSQLEPDALIDFARSWRSAGLPGDPPPGAGRFVDRDPVEVRGWIDAGFDLDAAANLRRAGLATAIAWRDAGFDALETYRLLRSDPDLTPEEARAYEGTAAVPRRREWVYYGFGAADAEAWAGTGLTPFLARIWRATGKRPADVRPGERFPPDLIPENGYIGIGGSLDGEVYSTPWDDLPDPPGTRGRFARRRRRNPSDPNPWIHDD